jgi:hypothetical protein
VQFLFEEQSIQLHKGPREISTLRRIVEEQFYLTCFRRGEIAINAESVKNRFQFSELSGGERRQASELIKPI